MVVFTVCLQCCTEVLVVYCRELNWCDIVDIPKKAFFCLHLLLSHFHSLLYFLDEIHCKLDCLWQFILGKTELSIIVINR